MANKSDKKTVNQSVDYAKKVKDFFHPSKVTWMSKKDVKATTIAVMVTVAVVAVAMIASDVIVGSALKVIM